VGTGSRGKCLVKLSRWNWRDLSWGSTRPRTLRRFFRGAKLAPFFSFEICDRSVLN